MKTGLEALKSASKKVVHKEAKVTTEFLGNKNLRQNCKTW